jgi:hypothetical protein
MLLQEYHYQIFADYFQFYLQDERSESSLADSWGKKESHRMGLAIAPGIIGIGTVRNMTVPVTLEIYDTQPDEELAKWDKVNECSLEIPSGCLVIAGCTDYFPEASRVHLKPQCYRVRVYYGGLNTVVDEFGEGADHYKVGLWPAPYAEMRELKPEV